MAPETAPEWPEIIVRIRNELHTLTPQNRKVAICILQDPMLLGLCGIEDFSTRSSVSAASVVRFAQYMGFSGFRDMRQACKQAILHRLHSAARTKRPQPIRELS
ncbi:MurR/RpiR family transcriptional regulator [Hydrogenophaga taeniospiralis]|jgi:DNA-binding MurR/RpiR family transcriptional regulator|uniref:MurR/RpiR family transcriptional regulator n=1 Tax=Hydrogenophaga taeniospiralis TaxID=65656 RepID=UPI001CFB9282|nr:hypothetical protein [Hydrogenophaga taeniospiralis]MCB4365592.1 MurR/RpiR family transcriptional regulator [Hydrogenophaga taeniospiralis]